MTTDRNQMSRRRFTATTSLAAAAVVAGNARRVLGANDRVVLASIGIRGQGDSLKQGFAKLAGVEIKTLCDVDENLFASRANDPDLKDVATFKPGYVKDMRRVFDDKDIDGVMIATPNHWHALATIWALQAGKHVYVEKPASHTVWEGRKMIEATARYGKIVQVGTMNRSRPPVRPSTATVTSPSSARAVRKTVLPTTIGDDWPNGTGALHSAEPAASFSGSPSMSAMPDPLGPRNRVQSPASAGTPRSQPMPATAITHAGVLMGRRVVPAIASVHTSYRDSTPSPRGRPRTPGRG